MQVKKAVAVVLASCVPVAPAVAIASSGSAPHVKETPAATTATNHHLVLHRRALHRNVRLARLRAHRLGHALAASYDNRAATWSLASLQRSNEHLKAQVAKLRRENALIARLRTSLRRIAFCESHHNPAAVNATGKYRGMFQFDQAAWHAAGGSGDPAAASVREQYLRAAITYTRRGHYPWPICGRYA